MHSRTKERVPAVEGWNTRTARYRPLSRPLTPIEIVELLLFRLFGGGTRPVGMRHDALARCQCQLIGQSNAPRRSVLRALDDLSLSPGHNASVHRVSCDGWRRLSKKGFSESIASPPPPPSHSQRWSWWCFLVRSIFVFVSSEENEHMRRIYRFVGFPTMKDEDRRRYLSDEDCHASFHMLDINFNPFTMIIRHWTEPREPHIDRVLSFSESLKSVLK